MRTLGRLLALAGVTALVATATPSSALSPCPEPKAVCDAVYPYCPHQRPVIEVLNTIDIVVDECAVSVGYGGR